MKIAIRLHAHILAPSAAVQLCSNVSHAEGRHYACMHLHRSLRTRTFRSKAWQSWWREERPSTFNAIVARDCPPLENGRTSSGGSSGLPNGTAASRLSSSGSTPRSESAPLQPHDTATGAHELRSWHLACT